MKMKNQTRTTKEKREYIERALSSGNYDRKFVETCRILAESSPNLDKVIADIDGYWSSRMGKNSAYREYAIDLITDYEHPVFITLTTQYEIAVDKLSYSFEGLVRHASSKAFKKAYWRYGKKLSSIGFMEIASGNPFPHIHCVFDRPDFIRKTEFRRLIGNNWKNKYGLIDYQEITNTKEDKDAVANYITKAKTKECFGSLDESFLIS